MLVLRDSGVVKQLLPLVGLESSPGFWGELVHVSLYVVDLYDAVQQDSLGILG